MLPPVITVAAAAPSSDDIFYFNASLEAEI